MKAGVPSDDINRIIIGLGGQGSRIVNEVRKAVEEQGDGALPPGLEFIAIDSDRIALSNLDSIPEGQRVHLAAPDDNLTETVVPWLPHEFRPKAGGGCGMQRLTGKAMYLVHRPRVLEVVRDVARRLRQRTQISNYMVVVVNAFGGGTGSGMAIDFSLDVRADLKEITGQTPLMFGVGILPSRSETIQRANGVAMIKELHFLLSRKEPVVVGGRDHSSPFELFFLVGREVMGIERDDDLLQSIVRFTIDLGLIPSTSRDASAAGKGAGWVDLQDIRTLVKGAGHMFSTFGYYRAGFPAEALLDYFGTLDEIQDLRARLPSYVTDLEGQRQGLEDRKVALAGAEEALRLGKARVARLRSTGILGANRPELVQLVSGLARLEEKVDEARREVEAAENDLPLIGERRAAAEARLRELETRADALKAALLAPAQTRTSYTIPLAEEEIARLRQERHLVEEGDFRSVMAALGRTPDYLDKTLDLVGKSKILDMPFLNYRMSFQTAAAFPPQVIAPLKKHGFVRFDAAGNPVVSDDQLWMVMAMLSSRPENIDASKVSARAFKEIVEGHVARRAEVKVVPSRSKRFEVVIHSWLVGIQVAPVAPGYPPRMRELEWLLPEYEQVAREGGIAQHHAFLYGDPLAFAHLSGAPVDRTSVPRANELVTAFWSAYAPIDGQARWLQLPPVVAEAMAATGALSATASGLEDAIDEFRAGARDLAAIERLGAALSQGAEGVESFTRAFAEDASPLRDRLSSLAAQLEQARAGPKDPSRLLAMEELSADAAGAVGTATSLLTELRTELPESLGTALAAARTGPKAAPRARSAAMARWEHVVAQAEGRTVRLHEAVSGALDHLRELELVLQRIQETLRARSLAPYATRLRHLASDPQDDEAEGPAPAEGAFARATAAALAAPGRAEPTAAPAHPPSDELQEETQ